MMIRMLDVVAAKAALITKTAMARGFSGHFHFTYASGRSYPGCGEPQDIAGGMGEKHHNGGAELWQHERPEKSDMQNCNGIERRAKRLFAGFVAEYPLSGLGPERSPDQAKRQKRTLWHAPAAFDGTALVPPEQTQGERVQG